MMKEETKQEITRISKEFASGFKDTVGEISGSGSLIVDPLSGYLSACGFDHKIGQLPAKHERPLVLILTFPDGSRLIPSGSDLKHIHKNAHDWMWI